MHGLVLKTFQTRHLCRILYASIVVNPQISTCLCQRAVHANSIFKWHGLLGCFLSGLGAHTNLQSAIGNWPLLWRSFLVNWIELKANTSKNAGLSKYQINWHIKYQKAGGKVFILNRPLLKAPYELLAVNRESRTAVPLSRHTDLKTLITIAASLAQGAGHPEP